MRKLISMTVVFCFIVSLSSSVFADSRDDEIKELKKIIENLVTRIEILEQQQDVSYEPSHYDNEDVSKAAWTQKIKLKGDVRYRNELDHADDSAHIYRQRIRARVGVEAEVTDTVSAAIGLTTGANGDNTGRSTNQTLQGEFGSYDIGLDYANIKWSPNENIDVYMGKFPIPLYQPGDLLWDTDLRFDGAAVKTKYGFDTFGLDMDADLFVNSGFYMIDYLGPNSKNVYLASLQVGVGSSVEDIMDWKAFLSYHDFLHLQNTKATGLVPATGSGTANSEGSYAHDYNVVELSGETTFHFLEQQDLGEFSKPLTFFTDIAWNASGGTKDLDDYGKACAWEVGLKLGSKPKDFGQWQAVYNFRSLGRNSFPDEFPDADAFGGKTNGYGHETIFSFGLAKNWWLDFDYYIFKDKSLITGTNDFDDWGHIFEADINVKF